MDSKHRPPNFKKNSCENTRKSLQKAVILLTKIKKNGIMELKFCNKGILRFFQYVGLGRILAICEKIFVISLHFPLFDRFPYGKTFAFMK